MYNDNTELFTILSLTVLFLPFQKAVLPDCVEIQPEEQADSSLSAKT